MLVNIKEPARNLELLPPALSEIGISGDIAPTPGMILGRFHIKPGLRTLRQYVVNADLAVFVVSGSGKILTGPAFTNERDTFEEKDFIYIERGEIFSFENDSDETCSMIFTYVGPDRLEDFQQSFVEAPN